MARIRAHPGTLLRARRSWCAAALILAIRSFGTNNWPAAAAAVTLAPRFDRGGAG
jgi:hypothetical protein